MTTNTEALPEPAPPFGSKRKAAMAVYKAPFVYKYGYIYDSQNLMVADNGGIGKDESGVEGAVAARVRGWGRLGYLPNGAELQDEIGQMMADALNALYETDAHAAKLCAARDAEIQKLKKQIELALKACRESTLYQGIDPMLDCINQAITALEEVKS